MLFKSFFSDAVSFLFCFILVSFPTVAQSASYLDSLDGKYALQFQISDNFHLSDFQGSTLSGKYNFSCRDAVRLGIRNAIIDFDADKTSNIADTLTSKEKAQQNTFGITINTQYLRYFSGADDISFYGGGGPFFTYSNVRTEYKFTTDDEIIPDKKDKSDGYTFGIDLILGVEWMFYKNMALSAEYGSRLSYYYTDKISENGDLKRESTEKYFNFASNNINFGLSVYF